VYLEELGCTALGEGVSLSLPTRVDVPPWWRMRLGVPLRQRCELGCTYLLGVYSKGKELECTALAEV